MVKDIVICVCMVHFYTWQCLNARGDKCNLRTIKTKFSTERNTKNVTPHAFDVGVAFISTYHICDNNGYTVLI